MLFGEASPAIISQLRDHVVEARMCELQHPSAASSNTHSPKIARQVACHKPSASAGRWAVSSRES